MLPANAMLFAEKTAYWIAENRAINNLSIFVGLITKKKKKNSNGRT
jgi:hypothetical protein